MMFIDFPKVTGVNVKGVDTVAFPKMRIIKQKYDDFKIVAIEDHVIRQMGKTLRNKEWYAGKSICITAGSRGIPYLDRIMRTICDQLKNYGAKPFIIPAMGSHGGGTKEGQLEILAGYNITPESMGVPVESSMDVVQYGRLSNGTPLYCDKFASQSDGIVILNKVKPHTDFRGEHESGLAKMVAIGIAKHKGATAFHQQGFSQFAKMIPEAAECFLKKMPVAFGVGIVQNAYDDICDIEFAEKNEIMEMDRQLIEEAKEKMARFKFKEVDVLIIDEIGKEISGYGQDPNVTGRANGHEPSFSDILHINRMFIRGITKNSHHNGCGIAEADITTRRCLDSIDWSATWTNLITSTEIQGCKIPLYTNNDRDALILAIMCCGDITTEKITIARIKNTLALNLIEVSQGLYEKLRNHSEAEAMSAYYDFEFDQEGDLFDLDKQYLMKRLV
jgi:hypothetical protein